MRKKSVVFILTIIMNLLLVMPLQATEVPVSVNLNDQTITFEVSPV